MRPSRRPRYSARERCSVTQRLRTRLHEAEGRAEAAEARTRAAEARAEAAVAEGGEAVAAVNAESAAALAYLDGPEWERDMLVFARRAVRDELMARASRERACAACGGFGKDFHGRVLSGPLEALCAAHGLPRPDPLEDPDWPERAGLGEARRIVIDRTPLMHPSPHDIGDYAGGDLSGSGRGDAPRAYWL